MAFALQTKKGIGPDEKWEQAGALYSDLPSVFKDLVESLKLIRGSAGTKQLVRIVEILSDGSLKEIGAEEIKAVRGSEFKQTCPYCMEKAPTAPNEPYWLRLGVIIRNTVALGCPRCNNVFHVVQGSDDDRSDIGWGDPTAYPSCPPKKQPAEKTSKN